MMGACDDSAGAHDAAERERADGSDRPTRALRVSLGQSIVW